ncbi:leucyl aminopeptidase [Candidatus Hepatobacter penaei]|uniref:leucyl aminopeptidase n=1 Tax=Candidatus Hepatobacter penaei TaxID=1274402 RepID=UPI0006980D09|nr:leucyl aminopeptidase [Candidatus Hepatobacter penaei]
MLSITFSPQLPRDVRTLVLGVAKDHKLGPVFDDLDAPIQALIKQLIENKTFKAEAGEVVPVYGQGDVALVMLLGLGDDLSSAQKALTVGGKAAAALEKHKIAQVALAAPFCEDDPLSYVLEGLMLRSWRFDRYKKSNAVPLKTVTVVRASSEGLASRLSAQSHVTESVLWARDCVNEPGNMLYPQTFVDRIRAFESLGLKVEVLDKARMTALGMGSLLGVAQGSDYEPFLAVVHWQGGAEHDKPLAFVGKGVTFDSGGLSIKPSRGMEEMKGDMGGAAVVMGLMRALALTKAPINAVGVVALVENMPSGKAMRPGDIVTSMSGQTIEVLNTDAEGRLILADALYYANKHLTPRAMVDVATLTGAMRFALGPSYAGLFSPQDTLAHTLDAAGTTVGEPVWRLPLCEAFTKAMESRVADLKNISSPGFGAGSSTAAAFLERFVGDTPWAHLDIANVDFNAKDTDVATEGGCAFGLRLLYHWATKVAPSLTL